ncbi:hypothetical protein PBY51_017089 [Eleginops maclovinus]|uniref:Uncharacterized protein n=1 Tax=Eleginops maclovinus TaxID=56733 RepID=A0AAN8AMF3_ELEMC|nr:hypothetical protein PBY51_017089 [Eleginops maclovinus]
MSSSSSYTLFTAESEGRGINSDRKQEMTRRMNPHGSWSPFISTDLTKAEPDRSNEGRETSGYKTYSRL